jgi:2-oxoglutarate dehydrogenase E1 component
MNSFLEEQKQSYLFGSNANFVEELYEQYLENPDQLDDKWKKYFDSIQDGNGKDVIHSEIRDKFALLTSSNFADSVATGEISSAQAKVWQLIENYRGLGNQYADLDPLKRVVISKPDFLDIKKLGLSNELDNEFYFDFNVANSNKFKLRDIVAKLDQVYCGTVGFEYSYITDKSEYDWLKNYVEDNFLAFSLSKEHKQQLLEKLTEADGLERFLGNKFVGQKRFSLEGGDSLIPAIDRLINNLAKDQVSELYIGMAHRGRLNVLVNINGKSPAKLFSEFEGNYKFPEFMTSGDVKYHKGYQCNYITNNGAVKVTTVYNPSHLEVVNPVVNGVVRANQDKYADGVNKVVGLLIHGDSAFIGLGTNQGVFSMSQTRAYGVGGLLHIVVDNQLGFTTSDVRDIRSSRYCTDLAKMIEAPVIHVNADDVERVAFVIDLATEYHKVFKKDIMIDLVCFRRHGHNEADDPTLTQPFMYRKVKANPGTRKIYADKLIAQGVINQDGVDKLFEDFRLGLVAGNHIKAAQMEVIPLYDNFDTKPVIIAKPFDKVVTKITAAQVAQITEVVTTVPDAGFKVHPTIQRVVIEPRKQMGAGSLDVDFGMAETLAYGSLLNQGINVRICGEDSRRGTFSHRHAVWHNIERLDIEDDGYIPLAKLENNSSFEIYDSILNEECALAFEHGYAISALKQFVMWEAQFGDFANGAQVVIDQFISSCEAKWGILSNVTMMLPHGYDGDGPEHSSARLERFLQLCAENNLQVVMPSTSAQMFHLIRRKALTNYVKPLVIFMSKRLLRRKDAASKLDEFTAGEFQFVIGDNAVAAKSATKIILCSGQIYYDLLEERKVRNLTGSVAIIRLEQLYPFPAEILKHALAKFVTKKIVWVQEEPHNQGAWMQIRDYLEAVAQTKVEEVSRDSAAAPACGTRPIHLEQLQRILNQAFK